MRHDVTHGLIEQLRVSEIRLLAQADELRLAAATITQACDGFDKLELPEFVHTLEPLARVLMTAAAEVEHGITSWRRALHRTLEDTQPIRIAADDKE